MGIFSRKSRAEKAPKIVIKGMSKEVLDRLYDQDYVYVQMERAGGPFEKVGRLEGEMLVTAWDLYHADSKLRSFLSQDYRSGRDDMGVNSQYWWKEVLRLFALCKAQKGELQAEMVHACVAVHQTRKQLMKQFPGFERAQMLMMPYDRVDDEDGVWGVATSDSTRSLRSGVLADLGWYLPGP